MTLRELVRLFRAGTVTEASTSGRGIGAGVEFAGRAREKRDGAIHLRLALDEAGVVDGAPWVMTWALDWDPKVPRRWRGTRR